MAVDTKPTPAMAAAAARGLALREEFNRGGTAVGVARARDIKNRANLSPSTIRRMVSFFARHEVDKKSQGFRRGEEGYPSAGLIAWCLPWDARVLLANGTTMPIGEIVDNELPVDVIGIDELTGEIGVGRVTDWFVSDSSIDDFYLIGTEKQQRGGVSPNTYLESTGEHPFWTPDGWVSADKMSGRKHARVWNWIEPDAESFLIGTLLGDYRIGGSSGMNIRGSHCKDQEEWLDEKARILSVLGGGKSEAIAKKGYGAGKTQVRYWSDVSKPLEERMYDLIYENGVRVMKPDTLKRMGVIGLAAIVCDNGSLHEDKRDGGEQYRIHTEGFDDDSVDAFVEWLDSIGVSSKSHRRENCSGRVVYVSRPGSRLLSKLISPYVHKSMKRKLCKADRECIYEFEDRVFKNVLVTCWHDTVRHEKCGDDKNRRRHKRLRYLKRYDITVSNTHSFVANGIVVHNCLWGGDPGKSWANRKSKQLEREKSPLQKSLQQILDIRREKICKMLMAGIAEHGGTLIISGSGIKRKVQLASAITDISASMAKKKAGNYRKGSYADSGLRITIENPKHSIRSGVDKSGKTWRQVMRNAYGYVSNSADAADGDKVDVFLGENHDSEKVFVIDQVIDGRFDEHKAVLYANNAEEAKSIYHSNYQPGWNGFSGIKEMTWDEFKSWCKSDACTKPVSKIFEMDEGLCKAYEREGKLYVFGPVLAPRSPENRDRQGQWASEDEVRKAARSFMDSQVAGLGHRRMLTKSAVSLTQSYIAPADFQLEGTPRVVRKGTWCIEYCVHDPEIQKRVRAGEFRAFSIGGLARIKRG